MSVSTSISKVDSVFNSNTKESTGKISMKDSSNLKDYKNLNNNKSTKDSSNLKDSNNKNLVSNNKSSSSKGNNKNKKLSESRSFWQDRFAARRTLTTRELLESSQASKNKGKQMKKGQKSFARMPTSFLETAVLAECAEEGKDNRELLGINNKPALSSASSSRGGTPPTEDEDDIAASIMKLMAAEDEQLPPGFDFEEEIASEAVRTDDCPLRMKQLMRQVSFINEGSLQAPVQK